MSAATRRSGNAWPSRRSPETAVRFSVRLTPRADRDEVVGVLDGSLEVRVAAAPVDGAANRALERLLARELRVPGSAVRLVSGGRARHKTVAVHGLRGATLLAHWPGLAVGS